MELTPYTRFLFKDAIILEILFITYELIYLNIPWKLQSHSLNIFAIQNKHSNQIQYVPLD